MVRRLRSVRSVRRISTAGILRGGTDRPRFQGTDSALRERAGRGTQYVLKWSSCSFCLTERSATLVYNDVCSCTFSRAYERDTILSLPSNLETVETRAQGWRVRSEEGLGVCSECEF